jgi:hypothetical protein
MSPLAPAAPLALDPRSGKPSVFTVEKPGDPIEWVHQHRDVLRRAVTARGWVRVRGLGLTDSTEVGAAFTRLGGRLMADREPFTARRAHAEGVYSSSQWAANRPMGMHHELSYALEFPSLLLLACLHAPSRGGATAVADSCAVLDALPPELIARFAQRGWRLTRNYNDEIGCSIADSFGTDDRCYVEAYCAANAIEFAWQPDGGLRTWQRRDAVIRHPVSGERCWFNQVAFLNQWTLDPEVREFLVDIYGPNGLPVNTSYGDGEPINPDVIEQINHTYDIHTVYEPWQAGDLMLVDNIRTAHSRETFHGKREVLIAMTDPLTTAALTPTTSTTPCARAGLHAATSLLSRTKRRGRPRSVR